MPKWKYVGLLTMSNSHHQILTHHTLLKTIGWDIGLLFTRQIWRHSLRTLTHVRRYLGTLKITCQAVGYRKGGQRSSRFAVFRQYWVDVKKRSETTRPSLMLGYDFSMLRIGVIKTPLIYGCREQTIHRVSVFLSVDTTIRRIRRDPSQTSGHRGTSSLAP